MKKLNLSEEICKYLNLLTYQKSVSLHTTRAYLTDLKQAYGLQRCGTFSGPSLARHPAPQFSFAPHEKNTHFVTETELLKCTQTSLNQWSQLSPASRNRKFATLKSFFKYLFQEGRIQQDLSSRIHCPSIPRKIPHFLSMDEALALFESIEKDLAGAQTQEMQEQFQREKSLFIFLYGCGLRVSECCQVEWSSFDPSMKTLRIQGKGGKERLAIVPEGFRPYFQSLPRSGTSPLNHLSTRQAYNIVKKRGEITQLLRPLNPHALRHSYATHLLSGGANLRILQKLLGHESLRATEKYTHLTMDQLAQTLESHHPLGHSPKRGKK